MSEAKVEQRNAEELVDQLKALVDELEQHPDTEARDKALDLVQIILQLYGEALQRILATIDSEPQKDQLLARLHSDEVIRAILLIHGLLPIALEHRVAAALDQLRPYLISQGADMELLRIEDDRARVRLIRKGRGAPPIAVLKSRIEEALAAAAPDLLGIEIEGMAEPANPTRKAARLLDQLSGDPQPQQLVQLKKAPPQRVTGTWVAVVRALGFPGDQFKIVVFEQINILVCKITGEFYAYRNACAAGRRALDDALFESQMLTCICHGYHYDLRRAGACLERPELRLESMPLKVEDDKVKVLIN